MTATMTDVYSRYSNQPWPRSVGQQSRFDAAEAIQVLARGDEMGSNCRGSIGVFAPVPRRDPGECGHTETICRWCLHGWLIDHHVRVFAHGRNGYKNSNCRCPECRRFM